MFTKYDYYVELFVIKHDINYFLYYVIEFFGLLYFEKKMIYK